MGEKKINYRVFEVVDGDEGKAAYAILRKLVSGEHQHLQEAKIKMAWRYGWTENEDGLLTVGQCRKASELDRQLHGCDFIILLNAEFWKDLGTAKQTAVIDHELCHAARATDSEDMPACDEDGHPVWRIRKHDLEEFDAVVQRHGTYKTDIENFAAALAIAKKAPLLAGEAPKATKGKGRKVG